MASSIANLKAMNYTVKDRPYPQDTLLSAGESLLRFSFPPYRHELWPVVEEEDPSNIIYILIYACAAAIIGFIGYKQIIKRRFKWNVFNRTPAVQAVAINEPANVEPMRAAEPDDPPAEPDAPITPAEAPKAPGNQDVPYCECLPETHAEAQTLLTGPKKRDEREMTSDPSSECLPKTHAEAQTLLTGPKKRNEREMTSDPSSEGDGLARRTLGPYSKPKLTYTIIRNTNERPNKTYNAGSVQSPRWR